MTSSFDHETTAEEVARTLDLTGQTVVLTGASSGIGAETARGLASAGADVVMGVRDVAKGERVAVEIAPDVSGELSVRELDLTDLDSVEAFARGLDGPVDALVANAGVSITPESHLPNGLDVRFATNHLGHFQLALRLQSRLAAGCGRVVVVSSAAHKQMPIRLDDLQWHHREHVAGAAYAESKTANILFAQEATRRWGCDGIFANAVLPGSALTGLQRFHGDDLKRRIGFILDDGSLNPVLKSAAQAAATTVWAVGAPELEGRGGLVLEDCAEALPAGPETHPWSGYDETVSTPEAAGQLWQHSLDLLQRIGGN